MPMKMALVGNPNSGKTTLFNHLTGSTAHVGNWPGVTVEVKEGRYKGTGGDEGTGEITVVDLPGIYSLSPYSPEEVVARNFIHGGEPAVVINIVDATNLERNLYLTTQILEMETPVVVALNMMDVIGKMQDKLDVEALSAELKVPVVPIAASKGSGIRELMEAAAAVAGTPREARTVLDETVLGDSIAEISQVFEAHGVEHPIYHAVKALENDDEAMEDVSLDSAEFTKVHNIAQRAREAVGDIEAVVADGRYRFITAHCSPLLTRSALHDVPAPSERIDRVLTHKIWGIPIFILIMFTIFHLTFSENLLGFTGLPGLGTWLAGLVEDGVAWITAGVRTVLISSGTPPWVLSLLVDGVLGGVGAVIGFLPLILVLYLFISVLEDSGYMARAAFIMDRLMRRFGLSGRSFVPLMMGFGCSVPAISATRTLVSERDRRITIMLIPFMSCGAKIPVYGLIVPAFFPRHADLVITGFYLFGILVAIGCGIILKNTVFQGDVSPFILELPPYRLPSLKSLLILVWDKLKGFAVRVGVVITLSTIIIWFLSNFGFGATGFGMVEANSEGSILGVIGNALRFFFIPLGFASGPEGWKAVVAVLSGLVAREAVVSTMGQLYTGISADVLTDQGAATALTAAITATFSVPAALSLLTWNLFSTPCMAAVGAIRDEMGSRKWFWATMAFHIGVAWVLSVLVFFFASTAMRLFG